MAVKKSARGRERRIDTRADARLSMRVEGSSGTAAQAKIETESQNISASGVYCLSSHYLPPLSKVSLTVVIPRVPGVIARRELLKCDGIVVRCEMAEGRRGDTRYELACMFAGLPADHRGLLDEFVAWRNLQALHAAVRGVSARPDGAAKARPAARATTKKQTARAATPRTTATRKTAAKRTTRRPSGAGTRSR